MHRIITNTIMLIMLGVLSACGRQNQSDAVADAKASRQGASQSVTITDQQMMKMTGDTQATILDVRTPEEYRKGHIKGALLANINDDSFLEKIGVLDKSRPVIVYCRSGNRSGDAAKKLQQEGFEYIMDYSGGWQDWSGKGHPAEM